MIVVSNSVCEIRNLFDNYIHTKIKNGVLPQSKELVAGFLTEHSKEIKKANKPLLTMVLTKLFSDVTNRKRSLKLDPRRMVAGQHHRVSPRHLHQYAAQAAWLEDHRRTDNGGLVHLALGLSLKHPVSRNWKGYWQR